MKNEVLEAKIALAQIGDIITLQGISDGVPDHFSDPFYIFEIQDDHIVCNYDKRRTNNHDVICYKNHIKLIDGDLHIFYTECRKFGNPAYIFKSVNHEK